MGGREAGGGSGAVPGGDGIGWDEGVVITEEADVADAVVDDHLLRAWAGIGA